MADLLTLQNAIHQNAKDHGFWDDAENANIPTKLMLIVSEVSEALEAFREDRMVAFWRAWEPPLPEGFVFKSASSSGASTTRAVHGMDGSVFVQTRKPDGFPIELADALIRILDLAAFQGLDMGALVELKMAYNAGRPHKHGGRRV